MVIVKECVFNINVFNIDRVSFYVFSENKFKGGT